MRTLSVQVRTACGKCGSPLPLNAMVPRLACPACSARNELGDDFWVSILGDEDLGSATIFTAGREITLEVGRGPIACHACQASIPEKDALAGAEAGSLACGACGARTLLRVPPTPFVLSGFQLLVGEDELQVPGPGGAEMEGPRAAAQPVAFNCPTCGGVLQVDGSARVVKCGYCAGAAYLPDDLWHVLHPVAVTRPWYLLHDPGARTRARHEAEDPATSPERLDELSQHLDEKVREAVARHPRTPADALRRLVLADESLAGYALDNPGFPDALWAVLAGTGRSWILARIAGSERAPDDVLRTVAEQVAKRLSDDYVGDPDDFDMSDAGDVLTALAENPGTPSAVVAEVARLNGARVPSERADLDEALAKHPNAPPALLAELARSEDDAARQAVAENRSTPAAVLESLAGDAEWNVREAVARRVEVGPETLRRLGSDEDSTVQGSARGNPSYPRFNLWKKLFGG